MIDVDVTMILLKTFRVYLICVLSKKLGIQRQLSVSLSSRILMCFFLVVGVTVRNHIEDFDCMIVSSVYPIAVNFVIAFERR